MALDLKIKLKDTLTPGLIKKARLYKNLDPVFKKIGQFEMRQTRRRIVKTKESPDKVKWKGWAPGTIKARWNKGNIGQGLLYDTKTMHDLFVLTHSNNHMSLKPGVNYAEFLQFGTNNMSARPFMGWSEVSLEFIERAFKRHFK